MFSFLNVIIYGDSYPLKSRSYFLRVWVSIAEMGLATGLTLPTLPSSIRNVLAFTVYRTLYESLLEAFLPFPSTVPRMPPE